MTPVHLLPQPIPGLEDSPGLARLASERGNLPLVAMTVSAEITGLLAATTIRQTFANPHDCPIEATYIFPLTDRAAVTAFTLTVGERHVSGVLQERQAARDAYDAAMAAGQRAALLEEDRPDVFTTRVGNLAPGEEATVVLTLAGPVRCEFDEATFRVPLVVAPRYIPGVPIDGVGAGDGTALDTDIVPDASRITPPVLLAGSPNPVRLAVRVRLDPAGMPVSDLRSSLHAVVLSGQLPDPVTVELRPGERLDRDFILRYRVAAGRTSHMSAVALPDPESDSDSDEAGTFVVTVFPPTASGVAVARDVVLLLDRSGSMGGWKMVAARRAAARIIDSLTSADRFSIVAFDDRLDQPAGLPEGSLSEASDRNRYRAIEWLSRLEARGGTEMAAALGAAHRAFARAGTVDDRARVRSCIVVTDGQVGDEDRLLALASDAGVRTFAIGVDRAVNAGLLRRLAAATGGRCELVESEDRLDTVLSDIQRRIGHPVLESLTVRFDGLTTEIATTTPARPGDLYPGVPLVISGRYRGRPKQGATAFAPALSGPGCAEGTLSCPVVVATSPAAAAVWARSHLRDLEDRYAALPSSFLGVGEREELAGRIVAVSLQHRVLCRFTAWVAVDDSGDVVEGVLHRVVQPVELPSGWSAAAAAAPAPTMGWVGAPLAASSASSVSTPPAVPFQPQAPPGTRAPARMAGPASAARAAGRPRTGGGASISLAPYRARLEELLAAAERIDGTDAAAGTSGTTERLRLAVEARLLAGDIASVVADSGLVPQLEALAAALTEGQPVSIAAAVRRLREHLGHKAPKPKPFWR